MTEDPKKPGAGHPDPLSATGMFLNAFQTQTDQPVEPEQEKAGPWFAADDKGGAESDGAALDGAALGGARLGGPWDQPLNAPSVPASVARPPLGEGRPVPGEFTQMFHKLEFAPSPAASAPQEARPTPEISRQEPGEFTRMFVRATASMPVRPMPAASDPAAFAPPAPPRLKGFSTPGVSDSASAEGSFTQLFQSPAPAPAAPVRPLSPLSNGTEAAWSSSLDSPPSKDAMESAGVTQLFRALSPENELPANRFAEPGPQSAAPPANAPGSITMLIQRLTEEDLQSSAVSSPPAATGPDMAGFRSQASLPVLCRAARRQLRLHRAVQRKSLRRRRQWSFRSLRYRLPRRLPHHQPLRSPHRPFQRSWFRSFSLLQYQHRRSQRARIPLRANSSR